MMKTECMDNNLMTADTGERKNVVILYLKKVLEDFSDEKHHLTQEEICDYIEKEYGIRPERKAIGRNLKRLREDFGMDICTDRKGSWLASRPFDDYEIRLLIDSVLANRCISEEDSIRIISKLEDQTNVYFNSQARQIFILDEKKKSEFSGLFERLELVGKAIENRQVVEFEHSKGFQVLRTPIQKPGNRRMVMYPLCILFIEHRYYVVSRHMGNEFNGRFKGTLDYVSIHDIEKLEIRDSQEEVTPLSEKERADLKMMLTGDKLQQGRKIQIRFVAPKTMTTRIISTFGEDVRILDNIHSGKGDAFDDFLPSMTRCIFDVKCDSDVFMRFQRENMFTIKVLSPERIQKRILRDLKRAADIYKDEPDSRTL